MSECDECGMKIPSSAKVCPYCGEETILGGVRRAYASLTTDDHEKISIGVDNAQLPTLMFFVGAGLGVLLAVFLVREQSNAFLAFLASIFGGFVGFVIHIVISFATFGLVDRCKERIAVTHPIALLGFFFGFAPVLYFALLAIG